MSPASRMRSAVSLSPAAATWSRQGEMPRMPCRAQPSMICGSVHCCRTVAVLSDSSAGSGDVGRCHPASGSGGFASRRQRARVQSGGTSTQRRSAQLCRPSSASCTPLAPSSRSQRKGSSSTTWRRNSSHCDLEARCRRPGCPAPPASRRRSRSAAACRGSRPASACCRACWIAAVAQAGDRRAVGAVDLERRPGRRGARARTRRVELGDRRRPSSSKVA